MFCFQKMKQMKFENLSKQSLAMHCQNEQFIEDILGEGAQSIKI